MDLISIARRYRNIRRIIKLVFFILIIIYACLAINKILENNQRHKIYESYEHIYETLKSDEVAWAQLQAQANQHQEQTQQIKIPTEQWTEDVNNIYKSEEKRVFLTFDDGPSKKVTVKILDILKQENVKATFFVLGSRVELNPSIVKRAYEEGHYIANHGYSHIYSQIYASPESILEEYYKTEDAIKRAIGNEQYTSLLFRFPGGSVGGKYSEIKRQSIEKLKENNIAYVDWNALTGDSEGGKKTVEQLISRLNETMQQKKSIVILMHDAGDKTTTYEALPQIIQNLRANGYEFKNFYDLIE